jgi:hypothetical protein
MNDMSSPPQVSSTLRNTGPADQFRGRFLDQCARIERWAADTLYKAGKDTSELQFLTTKLKELSKLAKADPSPFASPAEVLRLVTELQPFVDLRVALAHGAFELLAAPDGSIRWAFEVHCSPLAGWKSIVLQAESAKSINQALARIATGLIQQGLRRP